MKNLLFSLLGLSLAILSARADTRVNKAYEERLKQYDVETYQLYIQQDWEGLITAGKAALKEGFDFPYLRYRMGVAYFETWEHGKSLTHFRKADPHFPGDEVLDEYIYYAYLFSNRRDEALAFAATFPQELRGKLWIKKYDFFEFAYTEGGMKLSSLADSVGDLNYFNLGVQSRIGYRLHVYQAFTTLSQDYYWGDFVQHQYYISGRYQLNDGFSVGAAFHHLFLDQTVTSVDGLTGTYGYNIFNVNAAKRFDFLELRPSLTLGNMADSSQTQWGLDVIGYPFRDESLFFTAGVYNRNQEGENDAFYKIGAGGQLLKRLWLKAEYLQANGATNFMEGNGLYANNSVDLTRGRFAATAIFALAPSVELYAIYQLENKNLFRPRFGIEDEFITEYNMQTLLLGVKLSL